MADFEGDGFFAGEVAPGVVCYEVKALEVNGFAVLGFGVVAVGDEDGVGGDVLVDNEPRAAAEIEAFTLADGVEPVAFVFAEGAAGFPFDDGAWAVA